ncbi:MAG: site-2 protease family protein [Acidobacteria bacterium]|nr:site-2 protease family protein [Acidobacteriota bacterium]MCI0725023.1 site-2 protease family protein [Acidobacteriota bacterium]
MKWSWKLGNFAGINVYVHVTFFIVIGWLALSHWVREQSLNATLVGVAFVLAIFACVVLHEFGHALTARRHGIETRDITLLPIGGVARLERMPSDPMQELWVALAGPAVNVVIAALLYLGLYATGELESFRAVSPTEGSFPMRLMMVNLFLVVFNMLPAFPMDGGRVLRAVLATQMEYTRATNISAGIGQGMAFLFGFVGLFGNPFLLFIALFVWIGATQEASITQMKAALEGIPVERAMITDFRSLSPADPLGKAVKLILAGSQHDFPVEEDGKVVGVLSRNDLLKALAQEGQSLLVGEAMQRNVPSVDSSEMLEAGLTKLRDCECHTLPVTRRGQLAGLVTTDNMAEFMLVQSALRSSQGHVKAESLLRA